MTFLRNLALLALFSFLGFGIGSIFLPKAPPPQVEEIPVSAPGKPKMLEFVKKSNPELEEDDAYYIAKTMEDKAKQYGLDLILFAGIIRQESHFRLNLKACYGTPVRCDLGLGQISVTWVKAWKLDVNRLQYDVAYNLDVAARVLKQYQNEHPKDKKSYSRYYTSNPNLRKGYEKLVEKWVRLASA